MTILNYLITATWKGKGDVAKAKADLIDLGKAGDDVDKSSKKVSGGLDNIKAAAVGLVAAGGIGIAAKALFDFGKQSVLAASDVEEAWSKASVVFGDSFQDVQQTLDDVADATGRSKFDLIEYAATIQDTLVPLGYARDAAADLSTEITTLAVDLGSFNNIDTATVIQDLQSALVGNTETLRKYGVVASQAAIEQEAINTGLWDGVGAIDAQAKAQAILQLTIEGTADAQGDAVRTADSYANTARGLQSTFQEFKVLMGQELLPAITVGMSGLTTLIQGFVDTKVAANDAKTGVQEFITQTEDLKLLQGYRDELATVEEAIGAVGPIGSPLSPLATVDTREALLALLADFAALDENSNDVETSMRKLGAEIETTGVRVNGMGISWVELNRAIEEARRRNDLQEISAQYRNLDESMGRFIGRAPNTTEVIEEQTEAVSKYALNLDDAVRETDAWTNTYLDEWIAGVQESTAAAAEYQRQLNEAWLAAADPVQNILDLQQQVADAAYWEQDEAVAALEDANQDLSDSYRQMAFDAIYAGEGITDSTADLAIALGLITPEAADMRLEFAKTSIEMGKFAEDSDFLALSLERQKDAIEGVISGLYDTADAAIKAKSAEESRDRVFDDIANFFDAGGDDFTIAPQVDPGGVSSGLGDIGGELDEFAGREYETTLNADIEPALGRLDELDRTLDQVTRNRTFTITAVVSESGGGGGSEPPEFATGGQFIVPAGYPNDTFPIRVSSGERVTVETPAQVAAGTFNQGGGPQINITNYIQGNASLDDIQETQRQATLQALAEVGLV